MILFGSTTLFTGLAGISLHMQWPLTSQSHGSFSQREQLFFLSRIKLYAGAENLFINLNLFDQHGLET
jgi:hypothetical protein